MSQTHCAAAALGALRVSDAMTAELVTLHGEERQEQALARIKSQQFSVYRVVDQAGALHGLGERGAPAPLCCRGLVRDVARKETYLHTDMPLVDAVAVMTKLGARQIAVVQEGERAAGTRATSDVIRARTVRPRRDRVRWRACCDLQ